MSLEYSETAKDNLSILFASVNRITIYFEDEGKFGFYETLLERLLNLESIETESNIIVETLQGKQSILDSYKSIKGTYALKSCLFVVDADFDILLDRCEYDDTGHLLYLSRYNIESYIVDERSLIRAAYPIMRKRKSDIKKELNFRDWYSGISLDLYRLFILFAVASANDEKNISYGYARFISDGGLINKDECNRVEERMRETISDLDRWTCHIDDLVAEKFGDDKSNIICGKFLVHAAYKYLDKFGSCTISKDLFISVLVEGCDINNLDFLRRHIRRIAYND